MEQRVVFIAHRIDYARDFAKALPIEYKREPMLVSPNNANCLRGLRGCLIFLCEGVTARNFGETGYQIHILSRDNNVYNIDKECGHPL